MAGKLLFGTSVVVLTTLIFILTLGWYYRFSQRSNDLHFGASFSVLYAEELGIDWQQGFLALLDDLNVDRVRLMSYWDRYEAEKDQYDFRELDWQMDEAAKRGVKIMLSVGLRQPRWPECHIPDWADGLGDKERESQLFEYLAIVVQRYNTHSALDKYHLENEYFNNNFGLCDKYGYSRERLSTEVNIVQSIDPTHPVVVSFADQFGLPIFGPVPDTYATSLYRTNYVKHIGKFDYPVLSHFYSTKALLVRWLHGREVIIHELQLEPWGPRPTAQLSIEEQDHYMSKEQIVENIQFARNTGMREIYLWGAEWWYWRQQTLQDPSIWETVRAELQDY